MRPPIDTIVAPSFPEGLEWLNVAPLRIEKQSERPVLVDFWDFCRPESLKVLPHIQRWHETYEPLGLRVISVHSPGFAAGRDPEVVRAAAERLGVEHPVVLDPDFACWRAYDNPGWPARYLFAPGLSLVDVHHGDGAIRETELAIREQLGLDDRPGPGCPPDDADDLLVVPSPPREGNGSGPYAAGEAWAICDGRGELEVNGETLEVAGPGAVLLVSHPRHTEGVLDIRAGDGVEVLETVFLAGPPA
ncbi:MAG: DipZ protein [Solirubrobacterales bacterium]